MSKKLAGQRFGKLIAIQPTSERKYGKILWECSCDCGNTVFASSEELTKGKVKSCGCMPPLHGGAKDLTGQKFGKLVAVQPTKARDGRNVMWECKCDCGNTVLVRAASLLSGNTVSCGCRERSKDLTGQKFGLLTAVEPTKMRKNRYVVWKCECDCGNTVYVPSGDLRSGNTKSCGCLAESYRFVSNK